MENIETLKNKIIKYLSSIDLTKLDMQELKSFVDAVSIANTMFKADYMEKLIEKITANGYGLGLDPAASEGICALKREEAE